MGVITTSLIVHFRSADDDGSGSAADNYLEAEIDSREDGLNNGNTNFRPGDSPGFLVFAAPGMALSFMATSGNVTQIGSGEIEMVDLVTFAYQRETNLNRLPSGAVTLDVIAGSAPGLARSGLTLTCTDNAVAVVKATYMTAYKAYRLGNVPLTLGGLSSFPVVVVVVGTK